MSTPQDPTDPQAGRDPAASGSSPAGPESTPPDGSSSWTPPPYGQQPPSYGEQQPPPYAGQQPPPYGEPPPQPWDAQGQQGQPTGQPGAWGGQPAPYQPGMAVAPTPEAYASWGQRVAAFLIDRALVLPPVILGYILIIVGIARSTNTVTDPTTGLPVTGTTGVSALAAVGYAILVIGAIAIDAWNRWYKGGTTGQSIGKRVMGLKLVRESDGQVLGFGMAFVRDLAHVIDSVICYIGYLFPLWDAKRQTIADKVVSTVVYPGVPKRS